MPEGLRDRARDGLRSPTSATSTRTRERRRSVRAAGVLSARARRDVHVAGGSSRADFDTHAHPVPDVVFGWPRGLAARARARRDGGFDDSVFLARAPPNDRLRRALSGKDDRRRRSGSDVGYDELRLMQAQSRSPIRRRARRSRTIRGRAGARRSRAQTRRRRSPSSARARTKALLMRAMTPADIPASPRAPTSTAVADAMRTRPLREAPGAEAQRTAISRS